MGKEAPEDGKEKREAEIEMDGIEKEGEYEEGRDCPECGTELDELGDCPNSNCSESPNYEDDVDWDDEDDPTDNND